MFLSDVKILELLEDGSLSISPKVSRKNIRPNAVRVHLGESIIKYKTQTVDPMKDTALEYAEMDLSKESYILAPGNFVLGSTVELIKTPRDLVGFLDGRSTLARLGLMIHMTAAVTDGLYDEARTITLEIYNAGNMNVVLTDKMPIGSILFSQLDQPVFQKTQDQYRSQQGVSPANLKKQFS